MKRSKFNAFRIFGGGYHAYTERRQALGLGLSPLTPRKGVRGDSTVMCVADFIGGDSYGG